MRIKELKNSQSINPEDNYLQIYLKNSIIQNYDEHPDFPLCIRTQKSPVNSRTFKMNLFNFR